MKKIVLASAILFALMTGCKDEEPVVETTPSDVRDVVIGDYTCNYKVFDAGSGKERDKGSFEVEILKNPADDAKFDFRIDGLTLLMSGTNLTAVSEGYSFSIPEQTVDRFGELVGREIINVPDQTTRVAGYFITATNGLQCFCERATKVGSEDDLFEFTLVRK